MFRSQTYHRGSHPLVVLLLRLLVSLLLFVAFSYSQPSFALNTTEEYLNCSGATPFSCSDDVKTEIKYPFRTNDQPEYCGHPGYNLTCNGGDNKTLSMEIGGKTYRVMKSIDYEKQVLDLIDADLFVELTTTNSCPKEISNTSLEFPPFLTYLNNDINLTLFLRCNSNFSLPGIILSPTKCSNDFFGQTSFFTVQREAITLDVSAFCDSTVSVPVYDQFSLNDFISGGKTFLDALKVGFGLTWTVGQNWCGDCTNVDGLCGYNVSHPNEPACFCPAGTTSTGTSCTRSSTNAGPVKERKNKLMIIGAVSGVGVILLLSCLWSLCYCKKRKQHTSSALISVSCWHKRTSEDQTIEAFLKKHGTLPPKRYNYLEVKRMTESFHNKLGEGGFGSVYKGTLADGRAVAVKLLNNTKSGDGEEFLNEVASIGRTSHVNIVSLLGFCFQGSKRALIYDFMPNGSLEKYIYAEDPKTILGWEKLFQIAIGIARGLEYLHRGCNTRIVHFDIKPHNILLDEDFCPKIADFGLAKLGTHKESILSMAGARGTVGFIAPEVFSRNFGAVSTKSDVYSYGMMLLEMAGGRRNVKMIADRTSEIYFPHWIYDHLDQDEWLQYCRVTFDTQEIARKLIIVGLWCIQTRPECRPAMGQVVEMLQGCITDLKIPPKPYLSSPPRSPSTCSMTL